MLDFENHHCLGSYAHRSRLQRMGPGSNPKEDNRVGQCLSK